MSDDSTPQHKIGSGFGARSTADDVLEGIDLTGRLALVTGGYSGIGVETTRALAKAGARVVVPARRIGAAQENLAGIEGVEVAELDLGDLDSVRAFAEWFLATGRPLDIVIDSAGIMACPETRVGPGWEAQFATNHLGHFALVNRLWPAIEPGGARVVSVSSTGHHASPIRWDDVHWRNGYDKWEAYGQAKTANALFAVQLDRLGQERGCGRSRCTLVASSLPFSGICRSRRWSSGAGSTRRATCSTPRPSRHRSRVRPRRCGRRPPPT